MSAVKARLVKGEDTSRDPGVDIQLCDRCAGKDVVKDGCLYIAKTDKLGFLPSNYEGYRIRLEKRAWPVNQSR